MREQAMPHKVGERAGMYDQRRTGGSMQKPVKRGAHGQRQSVFDRLRAAGHYLPIAARITLGIAVAVLIIFGYRAAASASFFQLQNIDVTGTARASNSQIQSVVRRETSESGVWRVDLAAVSSQLERLPWVRTAVVSRVLPDGLRVRITEREPRAVVRTGAGRFIWVDDDAVLLSEMTARDSQPSFFLRGWNEDDNANAQTENRRRVQTFLHLQRDWEVAGLSNRVSELNVQDLGDVRAQLAGDDAQIEIRLGSAEDDLGPRLGKALKVLDEQRSTPLGLHITYIIMSQKNPIVGHSASSTAATGRDTKPQDVERSQAKERERMATSKPDTNRVATGNRTLEEKKEQSGESRKRRVGDPRTQDER